MFCKRDLHFIDPANRSHPIVASSNVVTRKVILIREVLAADFHLCKEACLADYINAR